jgi:hypothetical protein
VTVTRVSSAQPGAAPQLPASPASRHVTSRHVCVQGDYIHIQFHGSDFNAMKTPTNGDGWFYCETMHACAPALQACTRS